MKFIHGSEIQRGLGVIAPIRIAVAYVGIDWKQYIDPSRLQDIVLSPTIGTNPVAVTEIADAIGWEHVHFLDNLHAKLYLGESAAAVGSFNLTANGLSASALALQEAGFLVEDAGALADLRRLLEDYLQQAAVAYPTTGSKLERLEKLRAQWDRAIRHGVIHKDARQTTLDQYRPGLSGELYICWSEGEVTYTDEVVSPKTVKYTMSFLESDDVQPDRWILCWTSTETGEVDESYAPYWMHIDEIVAGGAQEPPYTKLAIECTSLVALPPPFELTPAVRHALFKVLKSGKFNEFLKGDEDWSITRTFQRQPAFLRALAEAAQEFITASALSPSAQGQNTVTSSSDDALSREFGERIRAAMEISLAKRYVTASIWSMLEHSSPVALAKRLVSTGSIKSGLKGLAKHGALALSFESIMLESRFTRLFTDAELECARFNLSQVDGSYCPPSD